MAQQNNDTFDPNILVPINQALDVPVDKGLDEAELVPISDITGVTTATPSVSFREAMGLDAPVEEQAPKEPTQHTQTEQAPQPEEGGKEFEAFSREHVDATVQSFTDLVPTREGSEETLRLGMESLVGGFAAAGDMFKWAASSDTTRAIDKHMAERIGEEYNPDYTLQKAGEETIQAFYRGIGADDELQVADTAGEILLKFTAENLGTLGPVAAIRKNLVEWGLKSDIYRYGREGAKDLQQAAREKLATGSRFFDDFLKTEAGLSLLGGMGASTFWSLGNTEEQKEQLANLGNVVFSIAGGFAHLTPTGMTLRAIKNAKSKLGQQEELWNKHDSHILQNLSKLVPEDELPKLKARMAEVRMIQQFIPEFKPSIGNIIGTKEARQVQAIIDTENFEAASAQYRANRRAVESLVQKVADEADPAQREVVAAALKAMRGEAIFEADRLAFKIGEIQQEIISKSSRGLDIDTVGKELKDSLSQAQAAYKEHVNTIYKSVDPEGLIKFDIESLKEVVTGVTARGDLGSSVNSQHTGYNFLTQELPDYLARLRGRGAGADSIRARLGMQDIPGQEISYDELQNIRSAIGAQAASIGALKDGSRVPAKLQSIVKEIDNILRTKVAGSGDASVAQRHEDATRFYAENMVPRFHEGPISKTLMMNGKAIPNDKVAQTFWNASKDDEVSNLKLLRETLEESGLKIEDPAIFAAAKDNIYMTIEDFAVRDIGKKLTEGLEAGKDAREIFSKWQRTNAGKMKAFPTVQAKIDEIGKDISLRAEGLADHAERIEDLTSNVIERYAGKDAFGFIQEMSGKTPLEIRGMFSDILSRNNLAAPIDPTDLSIRSIDDIIEAIPHAAAKAEAVALRDAISESTVQMLLRRSLKTDGSGFNPDKLIQSLDGMDEFIKGESLQLLLSNRNRAELDILRRGTKFLGDEITPQSKIELDSVTSFMNRFGMSIPSISSRIYAQQLGKVGPVFIAVDTAQRVLRGVSANRAKDIYTKTMYDLEGLEKIIDVRVAAAGGDAEAVKELQGMATGMRKILNDVRKFATDPETYRSKLAAAFNASGLLKGERIEDYLDSIDKVPEGHEGLLDFYLQANDKDTDQPSRTNHESAFDRMMGIDPTESMLPQLSPSQDNVSSTVRRIDNESVWTFDPVTGELVQDAEGTTD